MSGVKSAMALSRRMVPKWKIIADAVVMRFGN